MGYGIAIIVEAICSVERIAGFKLIACNGLLAAIVRNGVLIARNRDNNCVDRSDYELAVSCGSDYVLFGRVDRTRGVLGEGCIIFADLPALSADAYVAEVGIRGRSGKSGNAVLLTVVGDGIAVCNQVNILIVVEVDHILTHVGADRKVAGLIGNCSVAFYRDGRLGGNVSAECDIIYGLGRSNRCCRSVPVVIDRVAQVAARLP